MGKVYYQTSKCTIRRIRASLLRRAFVAFFTILIRVTIRECARSANALNDLAVSSHVLSFSAFAFYLLPSSALFYCHSY